MNEDKILDEIRKTKEYLADLETMLGECEYERWRPKDGEAWYYVNTYLEVIADYFLFSAETDRLSYKNRNCFQTYEQAKAEAEKISIRRELEYIARRLNRGGKIDWEDCKQSKYYIELYGNNIITNFSYAHKAQGTVYCLDENFIDVAIQEIGEERLKKYLRGE